MSRLFALKLFFSQPEIASLVSDPQINIHPAPQVTSYALETAQERGLMFCRPGNEVYEGQVRQSSLDMAGVPADSLDRRRQSAVAAGRPFWPLLVLHPAPPLNLQVVGMHSKAGDLKLNVCKTKQLTNMRAAGKDKFAGLDEPRNMSLDDALEYIDDDEQVRRRRERLRLAATSRWCGLRKIPSPGGLSSASDALRLKACSVDGPDQSLPRQCSGRGDACRAQVLTSSMLRRWR